MSHHSSVVLDDLTFTWPDGSAALDHLTASFSQGRTGLTGSNGAGKSTLLRLIAGELTPSSGHVSATGSVGYLPQRFNLETSDTVADLLGVRARLDSLHAIERGSTDPSHFETVGDDWDIAERARADLDKAGLPVDLERTVATLSGGETVFTALIGLRSSGHDVVLLDEPTNNLDRPTREYLYSIVTDWPGTLIVVSHDVELLDRMNMTAELHDSSLTVFGGNLSSYREHLEREQEAAEQALRTAEQELRTEKRQRADAQTKLARRQSYAKKDFSSRRRPKMIMNNRKQEAQVSAGKLRTELDGKVTAAQSQVDARAARVRDDDQVRISLPDPNVPAARTIAELPLGGRTLLLQGPERIAITGPNGSGKTRLLDDLLGGRRGVLHTDRVGYLPQRSDHLDDDVTVIDHLRAAAPDADPQQVRADLARFLFTGDTVNRRVGDLSGGERFRVALARLLLATPPSQLLILDEPTNNLDLSTVDALVEALSSYRGALIVVSHDDVLLDRLGTQRAPLR